MVNFMPAIAELSLALSALLIVLGGAFSKPSAWKLWSGLGVIALIVAPALAWRFYNGSVLAFGGMFVQDNLALVFKALIALGSLTALLLSLPFFSKRNEGKFEYPLLIVLGTAGMFGMVSAHDFLALYVSLELQSLSMYVLASFRRDQRLNSEAGLKYFFLGALSSGILLYGISLLYGFTGSTSYAALADTLAQSATVSPAVIIGLVLTLSGFAFKIAAAPFHMWTPDVYQGTSTPVTALFAIAPKAAAIGVFCRLILEPFAPVFGQAQQILVILAVLSMIVGSFAAIAQKNLKRLLAYSSIGHIGFILVGLAAGSSDGISAVIFYTALYLIMSAGAFAFVLAIYDEVEGDEQIGFLSGLSKRDPVMAASFATILLSMAGIPPLAGFFAKLIVFKAAVQTGLTWLAVTGVVLSVVSAYYYIRIIKIMYFDDAVATPVISPAKLWRIITVVSAVAMVILLIMPQPLAAFASWAVAH